MSGKKHYQALFNEYKNLNHRQNQIVEDANQLEKDISSDHKEFLDKMKNNDINNKEIFNGFEKQFNSFKEVCEQSRKNFDIFENLLKHKDGVIKKHTLFNIKLDELVEVPTDIELPDWFDAFKKAQFIKLEKVLEELAAKLYKARVTEEIKQNRERLSTMATRISDDIQSCFAHKNIPKDKIIQFQKIVCELQQYDYIIPQIIAEITNKTTAFASSLLLLISDFNKRCTLELDKIKKSTFQNDDAFKYEFNNVALMDPSKIRTQRYNIVLRNEDLSTLHEGVWMTERVPFFYTEYFKERNRYLNQRESQEICVFNSTFFEVLVPPGGVLDWNNVNYSGVKTLTNEHKGMKNTVFDKFSRILISVLLSANNFILVEIRTKPEKEILIYDSDFTSFSIFHEKIIRCLRAYIVEEIRNKTDQNEGTCIDLGRQYIGRSVNCPQVHFPHQNGAYFLMNLKLCSDGKSVSPVSYRTDNINSFRLDLFTTCLRIGLNEDRAIPFDVLI